MSKLLPRLVAADHKACGQPADVPGGGWGKERPIKTIANFANTLPDMKFEMAEVLVAGDRVMVRREVSGTPSGDFFGVPFGGESFRIMATMNA